ncbi:MAG: bifunctional demethylmenaquinone methyltransferase/2-methoxy-6-polyprenyl-1,4-benzoquinol methylase UbiE [Bacteroidales bacterium]|nr:bifunctional demethylmenaquinone methyltransferase/2-methoxy-6-polyprenyl-1,4-benzoquinol methylase UbiE [Bacteroidales bacterium]
MKSKNVEEVTPYESKERKGKQIAKMFNAIASRYDLMNRLISLGQDNSWREKAIAIIKENNASVILDIATGTGDMAINMYKAINNSNIVGCDISTGMLKVAEKKVTQQGLSEYITFKEGDCTTLPFEDNSFDAVSIAFGIRNVEDIKRGLSEIFRVLKPGGVAVILELSVPENRFYRFFYNIYTKLFIPTLGKIITGEKSAYEYLRRSIAAVPQGEEMLSLMRETKMITPQCKFMTFGACALYSAKKPK